MYPSEELLKQIEEYDVMTGEKAKGLISLFEELWEEYGSIKITHTNKGNIEEDGKHILRLATGGWSGNEDIIAALRKNLLFFALFWVSSHRGGLYIFEIPDKNY